MKALKKYSAKEKRVQIGAGHLIRAMQLNGFGHELIMAMRHAMETGDFSGIVFTEDCYTEEWRKEK